MKKILFLLVLVAALGGAYYGFSEYNRGAVAADKVEVTTTASDLFTAFEDDEKAANAKYLNKVIEVEGTITDVSTKEGKTTISLEGGMLFGITCELHESKEAAKYKKGQKTKLKGVCAGYLSDVVLVRCTGA